MWCYLLYFLLVLIVGLCTILKLFKLNMKWDRSPICLIGKTAIVTGANCGIGFYTAQEFAKRGAKVILACRSPIRAEEARKKIVEATQNENVHVRIVDFSDLTSVREFAKGINTSESRLDILVNNAGALIHENVKTVDGLSKFMQVNYFGPFLLTLLLIDLIKKTNSSRIINVSSSAAHMGKVDVNNLNYYSTSFLSNIRLINYASTKLCNILFTNELARRLKGSKTTVNSLHPGSVKTEIARELFVLPQVVQKFLSHFVRDPEEGAQTSIYVALSKDVEHISGHYFDNCRISSMPKAAQDVVLAKKLWEKSVELVQLSVEECGLLVSSS